MKDEVKRTHKEMRPGYSFEFNGKGCKDINRKIARKKLKEKDNREFRNF